MSGTTATAAATTATATIATEVNAPSFTNQKWVLTERPNGVFDAKRDVDFVSEILPECREDEVIVETSTLSVDAFIRTMLDENAYHGSVKLGQTLPALGVGKIVAAGSKSGKKVGQKVFGMLGAQSHAAIPAKAANPTLPFVSERSSLGLFGFSTGLTAYAGIFYCCGPPKRGQTAVVTAAAGAVGSVAVQLAKITGARVIGIAGGAQKCAYLTEDLKLDGAIDYKSSDKTLEEQIEEMCPNGIDFIYDNVGGETLDALLNKINSNARIVICGAISQYSGNLNHGKVRGPSNYLKLAERNATMKGFTFMQYFMRLPFMMLGMWWYSAWGKVKMTEQVEQGIDSFAGALQKMFTGGHIGKLIVKVNSKKDKVA